MSSSMSLKRKFHERQDVISFSKEDLQDKTGVLYGQGSVFVNLIKASSLTPVAVTKKARTNGGFNSNHDLGRDLKPSPDNGIAFQSGIATKTITGAQAPRRQTVLSTLEIPGLVATESGISGKAGMVRQASEGNSEHPVNQSNGAKNIRSSHIFEELWQIQPASAPCLNYESIMHHGNGLEQLLPRSCFAHAAPSAKNLESVAPTEVAVEAMRLDKDQIDCRKRKCAESTTAGEENYKHVIITPKRRRGLSHVGPDALSKDNGEKHNPRPLCEVGGLGQPTNNGTESARKRKRALPPCELGALVAEDGSAAGAAGLTKRPCNTGPLFVTQPGQPRSNGVPARQSGSCGTSPPQNLDALTDGGRSGKMEIRHGKQKSHAELRPPASSRRSTDSYVDPNEHRHPSAQRIHGALGPNHRHSANIPKSGEPEDLNDGGPVPACDNINGSPDDWSVGGWFESPEEERDFREFLANLGEDLTSSQEELATRSDDERPVVTQNDTIQLMGSESLKQPHLGKNARPFEVCDPQAARLQHDASSPMSRAVESIVQRDVTEQRHANGLSVADEATRGLLTAYNNSHAYSPHPGYKTEPEDKPKHCKYSNVLGPS
ncbi:hypothetical protein MMC13_007346 [Lambiella insularis]|nr:hypothetical protein [Lambiella insularis]